MGSVGNGAKPECSLPAKAVQIACAVQGPKGFTVPLKVPFFIFPRYNLVDFLLHILSCKNEIALH